MTKEYETSTIVSDSQSILEEAAELVGGPREADYGHPAIDFTRTAKFWTEVLRGRLQPNTEVNAHDVALMMVLLKISRQINAPKRDNLVDAAGYLRTLERVQDYQAKLLKELSE